MNDQIDYRRNEELGIEIPESDFSRGYCRGSKIGLGLGLAVGAIFTAISALTTGTIAYDCGYTNGQTSIVERELNRVKPNNDYLNRGYLKRNIVPR